MAADGYLRFETKLDNSGFDKELDSISDTLNMLKTGLGKIAVAIGEAFNSQTLIEFGGQMHQLSDDLQNMQDAADSVDMTSGMDAVSEGIAALHGMLQDVATAMGIAFSVEALIQFGQESIALASDLQEVQNVVDTAFGDMSYKMEAFAATSIQQFGISALTAKQTASVMAAMASGMGVAQGRATDMAVALTGLSADMASFYNATQEVTATALKSVFTGETESLKQFGIVMTQTNLEAYALSQGITKSYQAMSEAEKVQLRYGYVMQSTQLAQGDFAKTSSGWANQVRILSEQWGRFSTTVGNALMQVALPAIQQLNRAMSQLTVYAESAYNVLASFFYWERMETNAAGVTTEIATAVDEQNALTNAVEKTAKAQENALAGFDKINRLSASTSVSSGTETPAAVTPAISKAGAANAAQKAAEEASGIFAKVFGEIDFAPLLASFTRLKGSLLPIALHIGEGVQWVYESILKPFGKWSIETALPASLDVLSAALDTLDAAITALKPYGEWLWGTFISPLAAWSGEIIVTGLEGLANVLHDLADGIRKNEKHFDAFKQKMGAVFQDISAFWKKHGEPVSEKLQIAAAGAFLTLQNFWNRIGKPLFDKMGQVLSGLWNDHLQPLLSHLGGFLNNLIHTSLDVFNKVLVPTWNWIIDHFGSAIVTFFEDFMEGQERFFGYLVDAVDGVVRVCSGLVDFLAGLMLLDLKKILNGLKDLVLGTLQTLGNLAMAVLWPLVDAIEDFLQDIKGKFQAAWDFIQGVWSGAAVFFQLLWDGVKEKLAGIPAWFDEQFWNAWAFVTGIWGGIVCFFSNLWQGIQEEFTSAPKYFREKFSGAMNNIKMVFSGLKTWASGRWKAVQEGFSSVREWFGETFQDAWDRITEIFDGVKTYFERVLEHIKAPFVKIGDWFYETFSDAWQKVVDVFSKGGEAFNGIQSGISTVFTETVNSLIDGINSVIYTPFHAIQTALDGIRNLQFFGQTPFAWLPYIDIPEIPRLATGTVIPANYGEFLAVLGDNRREAEIVSPLSTMERAVQNALSKQGGDIHLTVNLDGKAVYRNIIKRNNESIRMTGKNPLLGKGVST